MPAPLEQLDRLLEEIERLRGELRSIRHVCSAQAVRKKGEAIDPIIGVIESIIAEALKPERDARRPEDQPH